MTRRLCRFATCHKTERCHPPKCCASLRSTQPTKLLAHFAQTHAIPPRWLSESELEIDHPELEILGGGRFRADGDILELWDDSQAYGRFREEGSERLIAETSHPWCTLRLVIR